MTIALACAGWSQALQAQIRIDLDVRPAGPDAERVGLRAEELVRQAGAEPELRYGDASPDAVLGALLARVHIDIDRASGRVLVAIWSASGVLEREIALVNHELDETAVEEAAQIVASSVSALLAGLPLQQADDERVAETAGAERPPPVAPIDETQRAAPGGQPPRAGETPRYAEPKRVAPKRVEPHYAQPPRPEPKRVAPQRAERHRPIAAAAPPRAQQPVRRDPPADERDDDAEARSAEAALSAALGYAVELFGKDIWLHGPQLAVEYAQPFEFGAIGARLDLWLTTPTRLKAQLIDAEASSQALRLLALYDPWPAAPIGLEIGAGLGARITTLEGVDPSDGATATESSRTSWAAELYLGARLRSGLLVASLGFGCELDPIAVDYGLETPAGFATTHTSSHVRPSGRAIVGLAF